MTPPASLRHAALRGQTAPSWPGTRRFLDHLQAAARPRFLSSVLVLGVLAAVLVAAGATLTSSLWSGLLPWPGP
jgi:hypothetical protein